MVSRHGEDDLARSSSESLARYLFVSVLQLFHVHGLVPFLWDIYSGIIFANSLCICERKPRTSHHSAKNLGTWRS
jgi:hypothetical protein